MVGMVLVDRKGGGSLSSSALRELLSRWPVGPAVLVDGETKRRQPRGRAGDGGSSQELTVGFDPAKARELLAAQGSAGLIDNNRASLPSFIPMGTSLLPQVLCDRATLQHGPIQITRASCVPPIG